MSLEPYYADEAVTVYASDNRAVISALPDASVDACVTDPPYELAFMGRKWDASGIAYDVDLWRDVLRVLKPGGHLLAFGGTRTWHRLAVAIEDAGFEIRDSCMWVYGSGFPKSLDVSKAIDKAAGAERQVLGQGVNASRRPRAGSGDTIHMPAGDPITAPATPAAQQWQGWGTALKPAFEPVVVARKPLVGTVAENVLRYGTGAINVDGGRVESGADYHDLQVTQGGDHFSVGSDAKTRGTTFQPSSGRWPANVILDESQAAELDRQSGVSTSQGGQHSGRSGTRSDVGDYGFDRQVINRPTDEGGASRFFYVPKADSSERPRVDGTAHPTVKPLDLMRYLVRLVTPPGGVVLEPFAGSGTTAEACVVEGFSCIAIEREPDYLPLILQRLSKPIEPVMF